MIAGVRIEHDRHIPGFTAGESHGFAIENSGQSRPREAERMVLRQRSLRLIRLRAPSAIGGSARKVVCMDRGAGAFVRVADELMRE
jgi:hypothetical protein